ncbi:MAG: hypothetical protein DDT33_01320 [Firmicutes bacterium]|nr:hypothetical protein [Bacillota bacterium]
MKNKCKTCNDSGYVEFEAGVIRLLCPDCYEEKIVEQTISVRSIERDDKIIRKRNTRQNYKLPETRKRVGERVAEILQGS